MLSIIFLSLLVISLVYVHGFRNRSLNRLVRDHGFTVRWQGWLFRSIAGIDGVHRGYELHLDMRTVLIWRSSRLSLIFPEPLPLSFQITSSWGSKLERNLITLPGDRNERSFRLYGENQEQLKAFFATESLQQEIRGFMIASDDGGQVTQEGIIVDFAGQYMPVKEYLEWFDNCADFADTLSNRARAVE